MTGAAKPIDTERFAAQLRARAIDLDGGRILISRLAGSEQEVDLTLPANCNGYGRVRHFRRRRPRAGRPARCRSPRPARRSPSPDAGDDDRAGVPERGLRVALLVLSCRKIC